ncbi:MAG: uroporphyrinogen-III synthase [Bacteroidaceae bacterium]|nr:uroporphyrinogen-III synthase [Bacteroidaceae bacterium]
MVKKILVSQPQPSSDKSPYFDIEKKRGVEIVFRPFIKVESLTIREFRAQKIDILSHTAIVFTSRHAIDHFFNLAKEMRITIPEDMKYFCITETVALYIQKYVQYRKRKVFFGSTGKINDLLPTMVKHKQERYFIPMSDVHNDEIQKLMESKKLQFTQGIMYRTVSNDFAKDEPFDYDMLIFFSPSGIMALLKNFPDFKQGDIAIGTFGMHTAKAAKEAGLTVQLEAPTPQHASITSALDEYIKEANKGTEN